MKKKCEKKNVAGKEVGNIYENECNGGRFDVLRLDIDT
jgi:hypothetical protein